MQATRAGGDATAHVPPAQSPPRLTAARHRVLYAQARKTPKEAQNFVSPREGKERGKCAHGTIICAPKATHGQETILLSPFWFSCYFPFLD